MAVRKAASDKLPHHKKAAFLAAYANLGTISGACKAAEIDRHRHYEWIESDKDYKQRFVEAHQESCEALENEARRRAVEGVKKPVFHKGERVATVREYSDTLLIFLMKGAMPDRYADRSIQQHTGAGGKTLTVDVRQLILSKESDADRLFDSARETLCGHADAGDVG